MKFLSTIVVCVLCCSAVAQAANGVFQSPITNGFAYTEMNSYIETGSTKEESLIKGLETVHPDFVSNKIANMPFDQSSTLADLKTLLLGFSGALIFLATLAMRHASVSKIR